jgi:hypothetical protein
MAKKTLLLVAMAMSLFFGGAEMYAQAGPYQYYSLSPCRVVDTRGPVGTNGGPAFGTATQRDFTIRGTCGVPATAKAVSLNVTVVTPSTTGWLTIWPSGGARPYASMINFTSSDFALANGTIVGLSTNVRDLSVYNSDGSVHVLLDVNGYFQ